MKDQLNFRQIIIRPFKNGWVFILANLVLTFLVIVFFFSNAFVSTEVFVRSFLWGLSICVTQWSGIVFITYKIDQKIPILTNPTKRISLGLLAMVLYSITAYFLIQILMIWLVNGVFSIDLMIEIFKGSYIAFLIGAAIALLFSANGYLKEWRKAAIQAEQFKAEMLAYKYEALRNQINPHFLFNSFNVLSDLIYEDQTQAVQFVQQMSGLFRYALDCRDKELVQLKNEMEFVKSYIFLLKTRFDNKIEIINDFIAKENELVVPMSLQLLIENAVKHNEVSTANPLKIEIIKSEDYIEVKNNLQLKNTSESSNGIGIKNIHLQYKFFTESEIKVSRDDGYFSVKLPLLKSVEA